MPDKPATLHAVAQPERIPCDGSYTCPCAQCVKDRAKLVRLGVRRTPKPLKRAA